MSDNDEIIELEPSPEDDGKYEYRGKPSLQTSFPTQRLILWLFIAAAMLLIFGLLIAFLTLLSYFLVPLLIVGVFWMVFKRLFSR